MVNINRPDVFFIEKDNSEYAPTLNSSVVGLVGFASKGPVNEATLITSPQDLVRKFGPPSEGITGQALEGALEILEATNSLYFIRASDADTEANASSTVQMGACPTVTVSAGQIGVTNGSPVGVYFQLAVTNNNGASAFTTNQRYAVPNTTVDATSGSQGAALTKIIGS